MGKYQSKHDESSGNQLNHQGDSFYVSAHLNSLQAAKEDLFFKNLVGTNLANYNSDQSSEVSFSLNKKAGLAEDRVPLQVILPPEKVTTLTGKLLTMDQIEDLKVHLEEKTPSEKEKEKEKSTGISVEGFECDVSVEGSDKQEWSFTLYDFDGRGKITKEDLASLMKSLYDAVGTSIKLPSSGTKTLRLRLSVTPDSSKLKEKDTNKDKNKNFVKLNNITKADKASKGSDEQTEKEETTKEDRKLTTIEQRHLVELVQKNMERHHIRQSSHLRRHHSDNRGSVAIAHNHNNKLNRNIRDNTVNVESQDRRNYYLDLAGVENDSPQLLNSSAPAAVQSMQNNCSNAKTHHNNLKPKRMSRADHKLKQRSRSHDVQQQQSQEIKGAYGSSVQKLYKYPKSSAQGKDKEQSRSKSHDPYHCWSPNVQPKKTSSPKGNRQQMFSGIQGEFSGEFPPASPHYQRRHRHREKDRTRAMHQVAEWIEREHLCENEAKQVVIQKHEHHHMHEHHHHHHYHHYHET